MYTKAEVAQKSDTELRVAADGARLRLRRDWNAGRPGKLSDVLDLALLYTEAAIRDVTLPPSIIPLPGQMILFDVNVYGDLAE